MPVSRNCVFSPAWFKFRLRRWYVLLLRVYLPTLSSLCVASPPLPFVHDSSFKVSKTYSKDEIAMHNKRTDGWIIIKNKVYDVTPYVEEHPGGDAILDHAGDDSTKGFFWPRHAMRVFDMIDDFYVGDLRK